MVSYDRHIMENDCFIQRLRGWMMKLEGQSIHVGTYERKEWMQDVNVLAV